MTKNSVRTKKNSSNRSKSVLQLTTGGRKLKRYSSIREAGINTGVDPSNISKVTRGVLKTAGGFNWKTS